MIFSWKKIKNVIYISLSKEILSFTWFAKSALKCKSNFLEDFSLIFFSSILSVPKIISGSTDINIDQYFLEEKLQHILFV